PFSSLPYEGELLYGCIARNLKYMGYGPDDKSGPRALFGKSFLTSVADVDSPRALAVVAERLKRDISLKELLLKHTLAPLRLAFSGPLWGPATEITDETLTAFAANYSIASVTPPPIFNAPYYEPLRKLKYCPKCFAEQQENFGFTYWRREWQPFGVNKCYKHHCNLLLSDVPLLKRHRERWFVEPCDADLTDTEAELKSEYYRTYRWPGYIHLWVEDRSEVPKRDRFITDFAVKVLKTEITKAPSMHQWILWYNKRMGQKLNEPYERYDTELLWYMSEDKRKYRTDRYCTQTWDCTSYYFYNLWGQEITKLITGNGAGRPKFQGRFLNRWLVHGMLLEYIQDDFNEALLDEVSSLPGLFVDSKWSRIPKEHRSWIEEYCNKTKLTSP
ncbi:MAG: TniQ family protein, partial [Succinivibrio sp.]|nr:TniQ family protein [Succinivibrio sp.]